MHKIGVITSGSKKSLSVFGTSLKSLSILEPLSSEITWVATNCLGDENELPEKVTLIKVDSREVDEEPFFKQIFYDLLYQIKIILALRKLRKIEVFILDCGYIPIFLFLFITLFLRGKTILRLEGRGSVLLRKKSTKENNRIVRIIIHSLMERVAYFLADKMVIGSEGMLERYNLQKYRHKISIVRQYVNIALFKKTKEMATRVYQVGYIGRFSKEKGILDFVRSLPLVLNDKESKALIVGEGNLKQKIIEILTTDNTKARVELREWIENKGMPDYLNDVKLLIVPSFIEGVPIIILEAMACGTPVLATPVGSIPEVIKDGETGFIMENNSPECIAQNIIRALHHPNLEEITRNARALVEREYTYETALERYRNVLASLNSR